MNNQYQGAPCEDLACEDKNLIMPWHAEGRDLDIEEAREAWVGDSYEKFEESFVQFDEEESFSFTFCWPAFFLGGFWFLYRKMYRLGVLLVIATIFLRLIFGLFGPLGSMLMTLAVHMYCAMTGKWHYWQTVEEKTQEALDLFAGEPRQMRGWMAVHGGTDIRMIVVAALLIAFRVVLFLVTLAGSAIGVGLRGGM
ncbi:DUF2628 domain-containing protein [Deltaproteobacteria bacterium OttesenSCG-928-M10]|nr:DUF2628 domain-containing protein [Deltaproteobacteria bacterium OttesenSCG-928-M10]